MTAYTCRIPKLVRCELAFTLRNLADDALVHCTTNEDATAEDIAQAKQRDRLASLFERKGPLITIEADDIPLVIRECNNLAEVARCQGHTPYVAAKNAQRFIQFAAHIAP